VSAGGDPAALEDAASLTLAAGTPHAVLDAVLERVLETLIDDWAVGADLAGRSTPTPSLGKNTAGG